MCGFIVNRKSLF